MDKRWAFTLLAAQMFALLIGFKPNLSEALYAFVGFLYGLAMMWYLKQPRNLQ